MIRAIGTDLILIDRFKEWYTWQEKKLLRIFQPEEIAYCLNEPIKAAERFAARFAAREALYKALTQAGVQIPFLTLCKMAQITLAAPGGIELDAAFTQKHALSCLLSLSHSQSHAIAMVIIQSIAPV